MSIEVIDLSEMLRISSIRDRITGGAAVLFSDTRAGIHLRSHYRNPSQPLSQ